MSSITVLEDVLFSFLYVYVYCGLSIIAGSLAEAKNIRSTTNTRLDSFY